MHSNLYPSSVLFPRHRYLSLLLFIFSTVIDINSWSSFSSLLSRILFIYCPYDIFVTINYVMADQQIITPAFDLSFTVARPSLSQAGVSVTSFVLSAPVQESLKRTMTL